MRGRGVRDGGSAADYATDPSRRGASSRRESGESVGREGGSCLLGPSVGVAGLSDYWGNLKGYGACWARGRTRVERGAGSARK